MSVPSLRVKWSVAVVQGGPSSEAEVSRRSAQTVARALAQAGHRAVRLELDVYLADSLRTGGYDVVFPIVHGAVGEDGSLQGLLEVLDIPYVGSGVLASALAMNKRTAKTLFASAGLPIAPGLALTSGSESPRAFAERALTTLGARVVVKPCSSGSAIGVTRFDQGASIGALEEALAAALALDDVVLVERFAKGEEITCGVLDLHGEPATALPPTLIEAPSDAFYTYEARYGAGRSQHTCPAPLPGPIVDRVKEVALRAHRTLGCRDLSRVDFVVGDGDPDLAVTLLEVNTLPGFTDTSLYPEAAGVFGIPLPELCHGLVASALKRGASRRNAPRPLPA